jgi:hypothetical protein
MQRQTSPTIELNYYPMDLRHAFQKTPKGDEEIARRSHGLTPRARSLLIMVNGKLTGEDLCKRAEALASGGGLFELLTEGGFIEAIEQAADAAAPVSAGIGPAYAEAVQFASHYLVEMLGPAYDELGARIESCRDPVELVSLLENCRDVVDGNVGRKKAEAFWSGVTARLP